MFSLFFFFSFSFPPVELRTCKNAVMCFSSCSYG
uniref:Uncharacterized protein n=1 Tax=Anguilla anguilla TaxID=7936 RepID=A0A0E9TAL8_ANGAN